MLVLVLVILSNSVFFAEILIYLSHTHTVLCRLHLTHAASTLHPRGTFALPEDTSGMI